MKIGIIKESHYEEKRVALAPAGVDALIKNGHTIYIEKDAGSVSRFKDEDYTSLGASVLHTAAEVYDRADILLRVSPPTLEEVNMMHSGQIVFSFLHLAVADKKITELLIKKKVTAIGYELIESKEGLPILNAMSEIAGQIAIQVAENYLEISSINPKGRGILLGGIPGVAPAAIVILGAGVVGLNAARAALGKGAQVTMVDHDIERLRVVDRLFDKRVTTIVANPYTITKAVQFADVFIGAVLIKGGKSPHLVTKEMVQTMKPGSVIIDISIDQGGCIATSRPTTITNPSFVEDEVIHICVPNLPALVPRTSTYGLTNTSLKYILNVADNGLVNALMGDYGLASGVCTFNGYCSNEMIASILNIEYRRLHIISQN